MTWCFVLSSIVWIILHFVFFHLCNISDPTDRYVMHLCPAVKYPMNVFAPWKKYWMNVFVAQTNIKWIFCPPLFDKLAALFPLYCARRTFYPCHPLIGDDGENMNVAIIYILHTLDILDMPKACYWIHIYNNICQF